MIVVVDSGVANFASIMGALNRIGFPAIISSEADEISRAHKVILPGVGSAAAIMGQLKAKNLVSTLQNLKQPVLGICLGMQILFESSEEGQDNGQNYPCLNIIPGVVKHLRPAPDAPVPHMGWNQIKFDKGSHPILIEIDQEAYVYFVHSYAVDVGPRTLASTEYGGSFTSIVSYQNYFGCQFHPERSGPVGARILRNFLEM